MKHNYLTIWLSACFCMCLSLCGNVSAQVITSFEIQRPEFISTPHDLYVMLRTASSSTEVGWEVSAHYNPDTEKYEIYELERSGDFLVYVYCSRNEEFMYVLPYSFQSHVTAGETVKLDLRNVYRQCNVTANDYYGNPFSGASLMEYPYGQSYWLNQEGRLTFYMPDGTYDFTISAPGYSPLRKSITMAGTNQNVVWTFNEYRKVDFKVKDQKGEMLENASVRVEDENSSYSVSTDGNGEATMFLADGRYEVCLSASGYWDLNKELTVDNAPQVVNLSFEGYRHVTFKVKKSAGMNIAVSHFYISDRKGENSSSISGDSYYMPAGIYGYEVNFDAAFAQRGMLQVGDTDMEKIFDFSDYKKAIIECSQDIDFIKVYNPAQEDYEPGWSIWFPHFVDPEEGEEPVQQDKTAVVYLLAGEYEINGHETPQTAMKIELTQSEQRFVYNIPELNLIDAELNFLNAPVDVDDLNSWYGYFVPKGYKGSIHGSSYSLQLPAGEYTYTIEHDAYNGFGFTKEGTCKIDVSNPVVNVDMSGYYCVNFKISGPDGEEADYEYPVVEIFKDGKPFMSGEGVRYLLKNGNYRALVWEEEETEVFQKWVSFTVSGTNQDVYVRFERANTSLVFVDVRNEKYEPVENAEVVIAGKTPEYVHQNYSLFTDIPCGENNYTISVAGVQVQEGVINVRADETLEIAFFIDSSATGIDDMSEGNLSMVQYGSKLILLSEDGTPYSVSIYNMNGNKLQEKGMTGNDELSVETLGSGIYILQMAKAGHVKTFKFVKR